MSRIAIQAEKLGKRYAIGQRQSYSTIADTLGKKILTISNYISGKRSNKNSGNQLDHIWALKDVNFTITEGEVVGLIGKNGAGKSTLLKILSNITFPTEGYVKIYGRVGSLLEVGTGFHPELTGRENVFLSGSLLGMSKKEIEENFDKIVKFSEIEKFLDTPVKRYSSGMYVRLAFAVAAHLEPEILLVDEVLAVGDAAFQKKCLGKMKQVSHEGRTVVFVSHSMPSIENLCERALWINNGGIVDDGMAKSVVANYINSVNLTMTDRLIGEYQNLGHRRGTGEVQFTEIRFTNSHGNQTNEFFMGEDITIEVDFITHKSIEHAVFGFGIKDSLTQVFLTNWTGLHQPKNLKTGEKGTFKITLPNNPLRVRNYYLYLGIIGNGDIPYDIWDGVGTEFIINYPQNISNLTFSVGRDVALTTIPMTVEIRSE